MNNISLFALYGLFVILFGEIELYFTSGTVLTLLGYSMTGFGGFIIGWCIGKV